MLRILPIIHLLICLCGFSQTYHAKITLISGEVKEGKYEFNKTYVYNDLSKEKHSLNQMKRISVTKNYEILDVKTFRKDNKSQKGIGYKIYDNGKIELYYVFFGCISCFDNLPEKYIGNRQEIFIKRKGELFAYNIGFVDGYGWYRTNKRLREFFYDCPVLLEKIKKHQINNEYIMFILKHYEMDCIE